jgi:phage tail P2-like protein
MERALEATTARISDVPILVRESWNPDTCPAALLPWLAWAYSVDEWDPAWTEANKRQAIKDAYNLNRRKGTVWAIKRQLVLLGYPDAVLDERAAAIGEAGATWAHYRIRMAELITAAEGLRIKRALERWARKSAQLWTIHFIPYVLLCDGSIPACDGTYTCGEYA